MNESRDISPEGARDRIEKDCFGIWAKRLSLRKQRIEKSKNLADWVKRSEILLQFLQHQKLDQHQTGYEWPIDERSTIKKSSEESGQVKGNIKECPSCHSSSQEPKDALKVYASVTNDKQIAQMDSEGCLEFELYVPVKQLIQHIQRLQF
jgi:hypothetical protein